MPKSKVSIPPPTTSTLVKYGLNVDDWHRLCEACGFTCVICGKPFDNRPLVVDHEHVKGFKARKKVRSKAGHQKKVRVMSPQERRQYVRGIVHNYCNRFVRRWLTLARAKAIVAYLEAYERTKA